MHKFLITLLIAFIAGEVVPPAQGQPSTEAPVPAVVVAPPPVVINNGDPDNIDIVARAMQRFADHGLQLPPLEITFSDTNDACEGFRGMYFGPTQTPNPVDRIAVCDDWSVHLYHELAHAWEHHSVTDATRAELVSRWQLSTWGDQSEEWADRGIERAAKTIAYTLAFDDLPSGLNVDLYVCAFELLTGTPLPAEVPVICDADTEVVDTPAFATVSSDLSVQKDPAADPRLTRPTADESSDTTIEVPWSWEHDGPGSNSLDAPWLVATDTP